MRNTDKQYLDKPLYQEGALPELGFFIAANDHDLLGQVNKLLARHGYVGVMDTAGRLHYLIDGRLGTPLASRRILEATGRVLLDKYGEGENLQKLVNGFVDQVLLDNGVRPELKGYRYLRATLIYIGLDDTRIKPISKRIYPVIASHFKVSPSQIERDIRYAIKGTVLERKGLTAATAICRLHQELVQQVEQKQLEEIGQIST